MSLNLTKTVVDFLQKNSGKKFTAREIAEWIFINHSEECKKKQERSKATLIPLDSDNAVIQQIVKEIGSKRPFFEKNHIKTTESRPRKYYFSLQTDTDEIESIDIQYNSNQTSIKEQDLYPILSEFLWSELKIYSKRIDEKKSHNKSGPKGNKWLYPDVVGLEDLSHNWDREVRECVQHYSDKMTKLWAFEVKLLVNRSNIREVFFQTISNSSWANYAYLVASEIEGSATLIELRILSGLHGLGFIRLDTDTPSESQIMIPAKEKTQVDWNNVNRLVEENSDFKDYIKYVRQFYQTGEIRPKDWDMYQ
ncbi:hypothetical protein OQJ15_11275 [Fluoribacter dumoffii]|uniref:COG2958 family protein n=1 Tax=Fluoribacter dumoffii TaxID=463 RepID=UPI002243A4EC|nr:hypothetical protein [Fluoribacter dumoffii]MCW8386888.1 hypothetical protein [Fluoribacter dumoffii]